MERILFLTYLTCLSLTSAFAITSTVTIPVFLSVISVTLFFVYGIFYRNRSLIIEGDDIVMLFFLLAVYFGFFINHTHFKSDKPTNHLVAYSYIVLVNYYLIKNVYYFLYKKFGNSFAYNAYGAIYLGVFVTCAFGLTEFWLKNILGINIDSYIPRPAVSEYDPLALTDFIRLRSFVEESGHLAYFLEVLGPIAIYYSREKKLLYYPLLILMLGCFFLTFSTAGWLIASLTYSLLLIWNIDFSKLLKGVKINYLVVLKSFVIIVLIIVLIAVNYGTVKFISSAFNEIVVFKINYSSSAEDRIARFQEGMNTLTQSNLFMIAFGNGPAVYDTLHFSRGGTILLYLTIVLESGLVGLLFFLLFCAIIFYKTVRLKDRRLRFALMFGLISSLFHFFLISNYWYPWFWILAIIVQVNYRISLRAKRWYSSPTENS